MTTMRSTATSTTNGVRFAGILGVLGLALTVGCGGSDSKKESTTPEEFIEKQNSKRVAAKTGPGEDRASRPKLNPRATEPRTKETREAPGTRVAGRPGGDRVARLGPHPRGATTPRVAPRAAPGTPSAPPTGLVREALALVRSGKYESAIRRAKSALRRDEKYVPAMVVMARAYYHLNKLEFAESICSIALEINANTGECYNYKGFIAIKNENYPLAKLQFEKATKTQPGLGPGWLNLGAEYLRTKSYSRAIPALERATRLMPNRAGAHLNLGSAYRGDGKVVKAQQSYAKALKLKSNYPPAYFNLGILFLDAQSYPGMDKLRQLNTAVTYFNKYKQHAGYLSKDDPVEAYIKEAQKKYEREQKRRERERKRKARQAAKAAAKAAKAKKPAAGGQ
jgi:Tfp pilus assembly protein PilF